MSVRIESHAEPIPGYRLIERIGGGGFGEVWKAEAPGGLKKAIKFVFGDLDTIEDVNKSSALGGGESGDNQRAKQEFKALNRVLEVRHPFILSLERVDVVNNQLIIVMELAERNLWDLFKEYRNKGLPGIPRDELLIYMEETAEALDLMNTEYQLQHLDIKPQNLFLMHKHVKVADFGLVKDLEGMQASVTGGVTPVYAAPETFDGYVSRFCDQYSLAIVYQELLTGQRPFAGNNVRQLILQHLQAAPNLSPLPPDDQPVIGRGLAKVPDQRFPNCTEMVRLLRRNSGGLPAIAPSVSPAASFVPLKLTPQAEKKGSKEDNSGPQTANMRAFAPESKPEIHLTPVAPSTPSPERSSAPMDTPSRKAPSELRGEGVLFPSLVIGVGQLGMHVLQRLRENISTRFGGASQLPNVRLLLLDTDVEIVKPATRGPASSALSMQDILVAPLNRPSHYLKPRDGRPKLDTWLNPRMLYRIPRSQMTAGVRALGRLAFIDHYRTIVHRLQSDLDACLNPNTLALAGRQTKLGVRTNRPRVYVVASLAGGTGSGMFLDLTYTVRHLLKQAGYDQPEVVGIFLLPPTSGARTNPLALGNSYAALSEINFFSTPGNSFVAQFHERDAPILDADSPYTRCFLLPMPEETDATGSRELFDLAGQYLYRDLTSPLGKAAEVARSNGSTQWQPSGQVYSTFGLYQVVWPRRQLLRIAARKLCHQLVARWMSRETKAVAKPMQQWMEQQWKKNELGADQFIARLREHCEKGLGSAPEDAFQAVIAPLVRRYTDLAKTLKPKSGSVAIPPVTVEEIEKALLQFDELLGKPADDGSSEPLKGVALLLREGGEALAAQWEQKLMELPVCLIEQPEARLAGAEEAVRQAVTTIEKILQHHEPLAKDLAKRANDAHGRLKMMVQPVRAGGRRILLPPEDTIELLRCYPKWRFQSLMLQTVGSAFVALRGHVSDELREINFLRVRLTELARMLEAAPETESIALPQLGRCLFPAGCDNLQQATEQFVSGFDSELLLELDKKLQEVIKRDFTALIHVCMTTKNMLKDVENLFINTAMEFAGSMLAETNVSDLLMERYPDPAEIADELAGFHAEAAPELGDRSLQIKELFILATPPGPAGTAIKTITNRAVPDADMNMASSHDDILFYRERVNLPLSELEPMGQAAQEAYRQLAAAEHFTPHTRCDIEFEPVVK